MSALQRFPTRAVVACAVALLAFDALAFAAGESPATALARALAGTWGTAYGVGQVVYKATPLLFSGVSFWVASRAGLFNIGAEGQIALSSLIAGATAAALPAGLPSLVAVPVVLLVAMVVGGSWGALAGAMRARFGAHEVIVTIVQNRIVDALVPFLLAAGLGENGFRTRAAAPGASLPRFERLFASLSGSAASAAFVLAVVLVFYVAYWQRRSVLGRQLGWVGQGADVCAAEGITVGPRLVLAMALAGAIAALSCSATVVGYKGYFELGAAAGAGFGGIAVALIARGSPLGLVGASLLVATLQQAGLVLNASLPKEAMDVLFGVVILALGAGAARREAER